MKDMKGRLYQLLEEWVDLLSFREVSSNVRLIRAIEDIELDLSKEDLL